MTNLRDICENVERGAVLGVRYGHNQYGEFESTNIWTSEQWSGGIYPTNEFLPIIGDLWQSMTAGEKNAWLLIATNNKTSCYAEFTRRNFRLLMMGLEPVKTPN
jgi:hypothetical protein